MFLALAVQPPLCQQVSCSWGAPGDATSRNLLAQMAAQGQAFFNASGDNGAYSSFNSLPQAGGPNWVGDPDDLSPYITEVGGTQLSTLGANGVPGWRTYTAETTWNNYAGNCSTWDSGGASGGGICSVVDTASPGHELIMPAWQVGFANGSNGGSTSFRNIPDLSICGENFWVCYGGPSLNWQDPFDGTSGAAPLWAGYLALVNQQAASLQRGPIGSPNPWLYQLAQTPTTYAQAFHDIADNSDNAFHDLSGTACYPVAYHAVTGYDLCTGLGSPNGMALVYALAGLAPTATPSPTITPTFTVSPTVTPTPIFLASGKGHCVLAPLPARHGQPLTLYFKAAPQRTRWTLYDLAGEAVKQVDIQGTGPHRCPTDTLASGLYFARIQVDYLDGTGETLLLKVAIVR
jgi:subtilase family serine protease